MVSAAQKRQPFTQLWLMLCAFFIWAGCAMDVLAQAPALFVAGTITETDTWSVERFPSVFEHQLTSYVEQDFAGDAPALNADETFDLPEELLDETWDFSAVWLSSRGSNGFGITDIELNGTYALTLPNGLSPLQITPGVGVHLWDGPADVALPSAVYDAYVDITWQAYQGDRFAVSVGVTPGIYGDYRKIDSDAWQVTGWVVGHWSLSEKFILLGGVAYIREAGSQVLPVGGAIWLPSENTRVELIIPKPRVAWRTHGDGQHETWLYIGGELGGGSWAVEDVDQSNVRIDYTDYRILAGFEWTNSNVVAIAEFGYVFGREITAGDFVISEPSDSIFMRAGIRF
jgi:hypothetical protein